MSENASQLTPAIRAHLNGLIKSSGLPETRESLEEMARVWFEKKAMFEGQVRALDMRELERFAADDPRGALLLTWSGSLLSMGPRRTEGEGRAMEYASIDLRIDVPHLAKSDRGSVEGDLAPGEIATLRGGPIAHTSPLLKIVACDPAVPPEEQEKRIREATIFLTNGFIRINRTVTHPGKDFPEQLTMRSMVTYLARKNELSQKKTRQLLDDYLVMLESGLLLGLRVPIGKMGKLSLRKRAARKARLGINPATGERITLNARPQEMTPRMTFSRILKDRARATPFSEG
jgi:nucleoid DNA-binding protein